MVATRFAVGLHILLFLTRLSPGQATSGRLAASVGTNPVVIRRLAGQLARAGLIRIRRGPGGAELSRPAAEIRLDEVWRAMRRPEMPLLPVHPGPARDGGRDAEEFGAMVPAVLRGIFDEAERGMEERLAEVTLAALAERIPERVPEPQPT